MSLYICKEMSALHILCFVFMFVLEERKICEAEGSHMVWSHIQMSSRALLGPCVRVWLLEAPGDGNTSEINFYLKK